ncbi:hypothetical protein C8D88_101347 [Lentzea atacamensis]|uniref:SMODS and SLOG-associating 2TM effector domain-containing protein n=1 Tax=Lentzea atacamensis TaxID=531938 RepID=A0A316IAN9_9PSEU|nr:hypothetical protein C8D88_101347 [Lentzea atacamensis]
MSPSSQTDNPVTEALRSLGESCKYNAQAYFEAAKSAEFWGKTIVFIPAILSAVAGTLVALGWDKSWGVASAMAGLMAATGSFLGAERKAPSYKESARKYTTLKHEVQLAVTMSSEADSPDALRQTLRSLTDQYQAIASRDEPVPNRHFDKASKRIKSGAV